MQREQRQGLVERLTDVETPKSVKERVRAIEHRLTDVEAPKTLSGKKWYDLSPDDLLNPLFESPPEGDEDEPSELFGTWRHEEPGGWVRVEGVMDFGASAPVAPPSMCPHAALNPSEGSRRGQTYTSASKHKMPNLGEQLLRAQTESGEDTTVLFQVADVSRPLISVSAICEMGNRVIFGRGEG